MGVDYPGGGGGFELIEHIASTMHLVNTRTTDGGTVNQTVHHREPQPVSQKPTENKLLAVVIFTKKSKSSKKIPTLATNFDRLWRTATLSPGAKR